MAKGEQTLFSPVLTSVLANKDINLDASDNHEKQNLPTLDLIILQHRLGKDSGVETRLTSPLPSSDAWCPGHGEEEELQVT